MEDFQKVHHRGGVNFQMHLPSMGFLVRFITEGVNVLFRSAKTVYLLGIHTTLVFNLNLPHGVGGIQMVFPNKVSFVQVSNVKNHA